MCHPSVHEYVQKLITPEMVTGKDVLEVGSFDVNGSVRPHCESLEPASYLGIDLRPGPRVDRVLTADDIPEHLDMYEEYDLVVSTEMLEHVENWRTAILGMLFALKPGGHLVLTTRSPGFPLHDYPGDHWRYPVEDMSRILTAAGLQYVQCEPDPFPGHPGVFAHAEKPAFWQGVDEDAWAEIELPRPY